MIAYTKTIIPSGGCRTKAGFTLIEMVAVLTIMTLLMSASIAAYNSMLVSKGVEGAKKEIAGALFTARMKAIRDRRDVSCSIAVSGSVDSGFVVEYPNSTSIYVISRMKLPKETLTYIDGKKALHKQWQTNQFKQHKISVNNRDVDVGYWVIVVGGIGAGSCAMINGNKEWELDTGPWKSLPPYETTVTGTAPGDNSSICIIQGSADVQDRPIIEQYKVSSDVTSGAWEVLPKFVLIDGDDLPITFRPDGTTAFVEDFKVIRLRDVRTDFENWTYRIVVSHGTGDCSVSVIGPSDRDALVN